MTKFWPEAIELQLKMLQLSSNVVAGTHGGIISGMGNVRCDWYSVDAIAYAMYCQRATSFSPPLYMIDACAAGAAKQGAAAAAEPELHAEPLHARHRALPAGDVHDAEDHGLQQSPAAVPPLPVHLPGLGRQPHPPEQHRQHRFCPNREYCGHDWTAAQLLPIHGPRSHHRQFHKCALCAQFQQCRGVHGRGFWKRDPRIHATHHCSRVHKFDVRSAPERLGHGEWSLGHQWHQVCAVHAAPQWLRGEGNLHSACMIKSNPPPPATPFPPHPVSAAVTLKLATWARIIKVPCLSLSHTSRRCAVPYWHAFSASNAVLTNGQPRASYIRHQAFHDYRPNAALGNGPEHWHVHLFRLLLCIEELPIAFPFSQMLQQSREA